MLRTFFEHLVSTPSESPLAKQFTLPRLLTRYPGTPFFLLIFLPAAKPLHVGPPASVIAACNVALSRSSAILSGLHVLSMDLQVRSQLQFLPFLVKTNAPSPGGEGVGSGGGGALHSPRHDRLWLSPPSIAPGSCASR